MSRPCQWKAVNSLSTYVVRTSWQTTPSGPPPWKMSLKNKYFVSNGNEKADALAKAATTREQIDRWIHADIKDLKRCAARNIIQQWQTRWDEDPGSLHNKIIEKFVSVKSKFHCASKRKETLISRLRLGKCALNLCLFLMKRHQMANMKSALRRMKLSGISS